MWIFLHELCRMIELWHRFGGLASEMVSKLLRKWSWNIRRRRNKFFPSTLLSDYLGQEVALIYQRSLCARPRLPNWNRVLKELEHTDCGWGPVFFSFLYYPNALPTSEIMHLFCFMTGFNSSLTIIITPELIGKSIDTYVFLIKTP